MPEAAFARPFWLVAERRLAGYFGTQCATTAVAALEWQSQPRPNGAGDPPTGARHCGRKTLRPSPGSAPLFGLYTPGRRASEVFGFCPRPGDSHSDLVF